MLDYSLISKEEDQFGWEAFWIDKFKELNNGRRHYCNRQDGNKPKA